MPDNVDHANQMFDVLTPCEAISGSVMDDKNGYRSITTSNGNKVPRPFSLANTFHIQTIDLFSSVIHLSSDLQIQRVAPTQLQFSLINGYVYPLTVRPIVEVSSKSSSNEGNSYVFVDIPFLVHEWNMREFQFRSTTTQHVTIESVPFVSTSLNGIHVWFNPTNVDGGGITFSSGSSEIPVQRHYDLSVANDQYGMPAGSMWVEPGRKVDFYYLSGHQANTQGGWVTYTTPVTD